MILQAGHVGVVEALLGLQVDASIVNADGLTALDLATDQNIIALLQAQMRSS